MRRQYGGPGRPARDNDEDELFRDVELEPVRPGDFDAFLAADELPFEPRPEFERALLRHLKRRYLAPRT